MGSRPISLTVQIDGRDVPCGTLTQLIRGGRETIGFEYRPSYLADPRAFALSPDMPLGRGRYYSSGMSGLRSLSDCMPDRWGRNLMKRQEAREAEREGRTARSLFELDYLLGVDDVQRQGAIRAWGENGDPVSRGPNGVPRLVELGRLLDAADLASREIDADVRDLFEAGSSLGGARPKASIVRSDGSLSIAKFPKASESGMEDAPAWEHVALSIAEKSGLGVARSDLTRIKGRAVLLLDRFDRNDELRVPYISGISAISGYDGAPDGPYTYLDLVEFITLHGARPKEDSKSLWRHCLLSWALGNTDNHMRNFGFLREPGGWVLSPCFDINPTPLEAGGHLATIPTDECDGSSLLGIIDAAPLFDVTDAEAAEYCDRLIDCLRSWDSIAMSDGVCAASIDRFGPRFDGSIAELRKMLARRGAAPGVPRISDLMRRLDALPGTVGPGARRTGTGGHRQAP